MKISCFLSKFSYNKKKRLLFFYKGIFSQSFYGYKPPMSTRFFDLNSFVLHLHNLSVFLLLCRVLTLMVNYWLLLLFVFILILNLSIFSMDVYLKFNVFSLFATTGLFISCIILISSYLIPFDKIVEKYPNHFTANDCKCLLFL